MEGSSWKTWLVVGALSVFGCSSLPHNKSLTYEKAVNLAVAIYNSKAGEDCVYRLLEVLAEPDWDPISESHQELNFTIKETMCLLGDVVFFDECDFKEDGVVRQCTGYYYFDERPPVIVLTCVVVGRMEEEKGEEGKKKEDEKEGKDQHKREKRFLRIFKKLKKGLSKLLKKTNMATGHVTS